jgi:hypothetical protein
MLPHISRNRSGCPVKSNISDIDAQQQVLPRQGSERPVYMSPFWLPSPVEVWFARTPGFCMQDRHDWSTFVPIRIRKKASRRRGGLLPGSLALYPIGTSCLKMPNHHDRKAGFGGLNNLSQVVSCIFTNKLFKHHLLPSTGLESGSQFV